MCVPLDVLPAGPTYVHVKTVSRHFGAETKKKRKKIPFLNVKYDSKGLTKRSITRERNTLTNKINYGGKKKERLTGFDPATNHFACKH